MGKSDELASLQARVRELERSEQLLRALDQASEAMIGAVAPEEVIESIATRLLDLGLQTVVLRRTEDERLRVDHLSMSSRLIRAIESRVGVTTKTFSIDYRNVEFYRRIVEQDGGTIEVFTEPGKGSRFEVRLPASSEAEIDSVAPTTDSAMSTPSLPLEVGRVLLVEDAEHVRGVIERCLERFGADFRTATCVAEAEAALELETPRLVICDVVLPDGNGLDLCNALYERSPDVGVVVVSGYTNRRVDLRSIDERGWVFLPKPFSAAELLDALRRAVA